MAVDTQAYVYKIGHVDPNTLSIIVVVNEVMNKAY